MREAVKLAGKKNQTTNADVSVGAKVPREEVYKTQLYFLLQSGLWSYSFGVHMGMSDLPSADIIITNLLGERQVLKFVAHEQDGPETSPATVAAHIQQCSSVYTQIDKVKEVWIINFTTRKPGRRAYVWPKRGSTLTPVKVVHVWHDLKWTEANISEQDSNLPIKLQ